MVRMFTLPQPVRVCPRPTGPMTAQPILLGKLFNKPDRRARIPCVPKEQHRDTHTMRVLRTRVSGYVTKSPTLSCGWVTFLI